MSLTDISQRTVYTYEALPLHAMSYLMVYSIKCIHYHLSKSVSQLGWSGTQPGELGRYTGRNGTPW